MDSADSNSGSRKKRYIGFKNSAQTNILLLREVLEQRPFSYGNVGPGWQTVSENLTKTHPDLFCEDNGQSILSADVCRAGKYPPSRSTYACPHEPPGAQYPHSVSVPHPCINRG
jgi:hypothetical protein